MIGPAEQEERIERIARDVLATLNAMNGRSVDAPSPSTAVNNAPRSTSDAEEASRVGRLVLPGRLVTLAVLEGRLNGVNEISVERSAVVTPAASDAIREQGIRLIRVDCGDSERSQVDIRALAVGVEACATTPVSLARLELALATPLEPLAGGGLVEVLDEMRERIVQGRYGLLLTSEPAAALCLANRNRGVRAVEGRGPDDVRRSASSVGANVLVVQPRGLSTWQQIEIVKAFLSCSGAACPEVYREALC